MGHTVTASQIAAVCDGDTKAVKESLEYILPSLQHGLEILTGAATNCARK